MYVLLMRLKFTATTYCSEPCVFVALENARAKNHDVVSLSIGYFTKHAPRTEVSDPPPVNLRHTLDEVRIAHNS